MSPYHQRELLDGQGEDKTEKLLLTLNHKSRYVLHYRNLQLYLEQGMKLKKIHKIQKPH